MRCHAGCRVIEIYTPIPGEGMRIEHDDLRARIGEVGGNVDSHPIAIAAVGFEITFDRGVVGVGGVFPLKPREIFSQNYPLGLESGLL